METVLIGYGEVGKAVYMAWAEYHQFYIHDPCLGLYAMPKDKVDVMLVAIGNSDKFVATVKDYKERFKPDVTIILSSVPIGTTAEIGDAVHSPIEGLHRNHMYRYLQEGTRWVGGDYKREKIQEFFRETMCEVKFLDKPEFTEFLKLRSTSLYGISIELARWSGIVCKELGMDSDTIKEYDRFYNQLNKDMGKPEYQRYVLDPPTGRIGGHCVIPNALILRRQRKYSHPMIDYLAGLDDYLAAVEQEGRLEEVLSDRKFLYGEEGEE